MQFTYFQLPLHRFINPLKIHFADLNGKVPEIHDWYPVASGFYVVIPMFVTIIANIILLVKVFNITRRHGDVLPNRGEKWGFQEIRFYY